jgi:hypothetical protein
MSDSFSFVTFVSSSEQEKPTQSPPVEIQHNKVEDKPATPQEPADKELLPLHNQAEQRIPETQEQDNPSQEAAADVSSVLNEQKTLPLKKAKPQEILQGPGSGKPIDKQRPTSSNVPKEQVVQKPWWQPQWPSQWWLNFTGWISRKIQQIKDFWACV